MSGASQLAPPTLLTLISSPFPPREGAEPFCECFFRTGKVAGALYTHFAIML